MPELLALIRALKAIAKDLGRAERAARAILNKRPRKRPRAPHSTARSEETDRVVSCWEPVRSVNAR